LETILRFLSHLFNYHQIVGGVPKNTNFRLSRNYATTIVVDMTHLMVVRTTKKEIITNKISYF
jgi:hypothetical protein